jgi:hypothetical protein
LSLNRVYAEEEGGVGIHSTGFISFGEAQCVRRVLEAISSSLYVIFPSKLTGAEHPQSPWPHPLFS